MTYTGAIRLLTDKDFMSPKLDLRVFLCYKYKINIKFVHRPYSAVKGLYNTKKTNIIH